MTVLANWGNELIIRNSLAQYFYVEKDHMVPIQLGEVEEYGPASFVLPDGSILTGDFDPSGNEIINLEIRRAS